MPTTIPNGQPLFTFTPILTYSEFDPPVPTTLIPIDDGTVVYWDQSIYGTLIKRVRVTASAIVGDSVNPKIIYLGIQKYDDSGDPVIISDIVIYDTLLMEASGIITDTDVIPFVEFTFGDTTTGNGLLLNPFDRIVIAANNNEGKSGEVGDRVSVIVEGGTYDNNE